MGGHTVVYDWVKANEFKKSDLDEFSEEQWVKEEKKYYIRLRDQAFKFVIDDDDLISWSIKYLASRVIHIYVEQVQVEIDSDFEDPDFVIGNELSDDDNDDQIFEGNVEHVGSDLDEIDESNVVGSTTYVNKGSEQCDYDKEGGIQLVVDIERGKQPVVDEYDSGGGGDPDLLDGDDEVDFDEYRVSDEDNDEPNYPVFNPKTIFDPVFSIGQIFGTNQEFRKAAQSYAIKVKRNIHVPKNDTRRIYAECAMKNVNGRFVR